MRSTGYAIQQTLNAAMVAALYSLLAVAYALLHGITNRIVLSFGDIAMFGAFYTVYLMLLLLVTGTGTGIALGGVLYRRAGRHRRARHCGQSRRLRTARANARARRS